MNRVDYFSGEQALDVSSLSSTQQAEQMASFGQYGYSPAPIQLGTQGYNGGGIGMPPYGYQQPHQMYGNPQYGYQQQAMYGQGNPAFQFINRNAYRPQAQDITYNVPGLNLFGDRLYKSDYEDKVDKIMWDAWFKEQTAVIENSQPNFGYGYGSNYYGYGYGASSQSQYYREAMSQINEMNRQAHLDMIDMHVNLSKLAHNYLGDSYDESAIREMYTGKTVAVPGVNTVDLWEDQRLRNLVPFDNSAMYRAADAAVSAEFHKRIRPDATLNEFLENLALVAYDWEMEEEKHRRNQELRMSYNGDAYMMLVRQKAYENKINRGIKEAEDKVRSMRDNLLHSGMFPTLEHNTVVKDDGTICITYNYPGDEAVAAMNENESQYEHERERFRNFVQSISPSLKITEQMGGRANNGG